jgi:hypothetical protein
MELRWGMLKKWQRCGALGVAIGGAVSSACHIGRKGWGGTPFERTSARKQKSLRYAKR